MRLINCCLLSTLRLLNERYYIYAKDDHWLLTAMLSALFRVKTIYFYCEMLIL